MRELIVQVLSHYLLDPYCLLSDNKEVQDNIQVQFRIYFLYIQQRLSMEQKDMIILKAITLGNFAQKTIVISGISAVLHNFYHGFNELNLMI